MPDLHRFVCNWLCKLQIFYENNVKMSKRFLFGNRNNETLAVCLRMATSKKARCTHSS